MTHGLPPQGFTRLRTIIGDAAMDRSTGRKQRDSQQLPLIGVSRTEWFRGSKTTQKYPPGIQLSRKLVVYRNEHLIEFLRDPTAPPHTRSWYRTDASDARPATAGAPAVELGAE